MNIKYVALPNPAINMNHIYQATRLVDDSFATGYFKNHLNEIECAWMALHEDKVVGWAAIAIDPDNEVCILRCIVVDPEYRGKGIGKRLTEERLKYLDNCSVVISYAWVRPDGKCMSCKNLENFGFELQEELYEYYNKTRKNCKYCGSSCTCIAKLYLKKHST
jgi:N-acetylglutamate synthase-like GNAT family acetyltransferase